MKLEMLHAGSSDQKTNKNLLHDICMHRNDNFNLEILSLHLSSEFPLAYGFINTKHKQKSSRGHVTQCGTYIISCYEANVSTLWFHGGWGYNNCLELFAGIIRPL